MQRNFWASVAAFIRQYRMRKSWRRVVSALTCVVVFCTTYALILPAITMEGVYSCGLQEHVHTEECRSQTVYTELSCSGAHSHSDASYDQDGTLTCGLADFVVHSHNEFCYAEDGTLRCTLIQVTEHSGDEGVYYVLEGSEAPNTTAHIHSDSCYVTLRGQLLCPLTEGEAHIHDADCYDTARISCTLEEKEGHIHTEDCYTQIQSCEDEAHAHDDTCYYRELTCGQEEDGHTHTDACKQPALTCTLSTEPHVHDDSCYELLTETVCGKLSLTKHDHSASCVHTEIQEDLLCGKEEHLHTLICYSDPNADLETAENWEAALKDLELDGTAAENLLSVARTQLGYTESKLNYTVLEDGITQKGYTRYGAWSGTPYADWNELFLEFCLHYAGIEEETFPRAQEDKTWQETLNAQGLTYTTDGTPIPGDLIFLRIEETPYTGLVTTVSDDYVTAILADYKNEVRAETFTRADEAILAYALLPEPEEEVSQNTEETQPQSGEEAVPGVHDEPLRADIDLGTLSAPQAAENTVAAFSLRSSRIQTYAEETADTTTYPDMDDFIDNMAIFYKQPGESGWTPVLNGMVLEKGTNLRYELTYTIDKGTLDATNNIVTYQLPVNITTLESTGHVTSNGANVGIYVVDENGLMTITYYPDFAAQNVGKDITGTIFFEAQLDNFKENDDGSINLGEDEGESYTVTIKEETQSNSDIKVSKEATNVDEKSGIITYRITVSTEKGTPGVIKLTDTMNNATFVPDSLQVKDHSGIEIENTEFWITQNNDRVFDLELPKLEAGGSYTIEYQAKVTTASQGYTGVGNYVNVSSTKDNDRVQDSQYVGTNISFGDNPLNKTHKVGQDGMVEWTITIDASKIDPSGWTLTDTMSADITNITLEYTVIENNSIVNKTETITGLPYTFKDGEYTGFITVTYSSKMDYVLGQSGVYNSATITPPDGQFNPPYSEGESAPYPEGSYNVVDKKLYKHEQNETTHEPTELIWQLTIGPNYEEYNESWTLTDTLSANQYYTAEQQSEIETQIEDMLSKIYPGQEVQYTLEFTGEYPVGEETYKTGFLLKVDAPLPVITKENAVTITYSSTPDIGSGDTQMYLSNTVNFDSRTQDIDGMNYNPILNKWGSDWWSSDVRVFNMSNNELPEKLVWHIQLKITEEMKEAAANGKSVIITEDVPDDSRLTLSYFWFGHQDRTVNDGFLSQDKDKDGQYDEYTFSAYNSNQEVRIRKTVSESGDIQYILTIPPETISKIDTFEFSIYFNLAKDFIPTQYPDENYEFMYDSFTNTVSVNIEGENPIAEDHQTQVIIDPSITQNEDHEDIETVLKYMAPPTGEDENRKSYVIQVNRNAEDLDPDSDWLKVNDVLSFTNTINERGEKIFANLLPDTVKISIYNADGTPHVFTTADGQEQTFEKAPLDAYMGAELLKSQLALPGTYTTSVSTELDNKENPKEETTDYIIDFYVPDGCFVRLEYDYQFGGYGEVRVNNVAKVTSYGSEHQGDSQTSVNIDNIGVSAEVSQLNIKKVDKNNRNLTLPGAVYELYEYVELTDENGAGTGKWEWEYQYIAESDENGELILGGKEGDVSIEHVLNAETFYYLVEIKAPVQKDAAGNVLHRYVLDETRHYFLIKDEQETTPTKPETPPPDFPNTAYFPNGYILEIENEYGERSISVDKKWLNADGTEMAAPPPDQQVTIALEQYRTYDNPEVNYEDYGQKAIVTLQVGDNSYLENVFSSQNIIEAIGPITRKEIQADGTVQEVESNKILIGDVITITYKNLAINPASAEDQLPGLMNMTSDANYHIPYTWEAGTTSGCWDYIFQLRVRGDSDLRGWTYGKACDRVTVTVNPYDPTKPVQGGKIDTTQGEGYYYRTVTFQDDNWSQIWSGLPKYDLDDHGRKLGYYIYELQEVNVGDYVTDIVTSKDGRTTTIVNKVPSDMDLTVQKQWPDGPGANTEIRFDLYQVTHTEKPDTELADITLQFGNGATDYDDPTNYYDGMIREIPVGATIRVYVKCDTWYGNFTCTGENAVTSGNGYFDILVASDGTVQFRTDGKETETPTLTYEVILPDASFEQARIYGTYTITAADGWTTHLTGLPLEAMVNGEHLYYSYYIQETVPEGYEASYTVKYGGVVYEDGQYIPTYAICPSVAQSGSELIIYNDWIEDDKIRLEVEKKWVNSENQEVIAPRDVEKIDFTVTKLADSGNTVSIGFDFRNGNQNRVPVKSGDQEITQYEVPLGATVYLEMVGPSWVNGQTSVAFNGTELSCYDWQADTPVQNSSTWKYSFVANTDGEITGNLTWTEVTAWDIRVSYIFNAADSVLGTYSLTPGNGWTWISPQRLDPGTYRVEEVTPGYTVTYTVNGQAGNSGTFEANSTGTFVIYNEVDRSDIDIPVQKIWNISGMTEYPEITVALYQFTHTEAPTGETVTYGSAVDVSGLTAFKAETIRGNDTVTFTDLPTFVKNADGTTTYYTYHVVETTGGYTTSYSGRDDGTVVITNSVQYVLPESGGPGTMMYTLGGLGLCGLAVLGYKPRKRRKGDETS